MGERFEGVAIRAKISAALLVAGAAGMKCTEVAAAIGEVERNVRWYMATSVGLAVKAATRSQQLIRWYHPTQADAARQYVEAMNAKGRQKSRVSSATMDAAIAAAIDGRSLVEVAAAIRRTPRCLREFMPRLVRDGRITAVVWPARNAGGTILRYWSVSEQAQHPPVQAPKVRVRASRAKPKALHKRPDPKIGQRMAGALSKPLKPLAKAQHNGEIIVPAHVRVQVCPSSTDNRYTVHRVEPFFSALAPGNYLRTGSAIERAYGGGE